MNANDVRQKYLDFMTKHGHKHIAAAPLVLTDDPTTLFTSSGMQPLLPYLLGQEHPEGKRLADSQPSLRTQDIDDIGDNRHTTCFEMLGNWSLGEYFKEEQLPMLFEFLTKEIGLDPKRLYVSCFEGNEEYGIPRDDESAQIWQQLFKSVGIDAKIGERIFFYDDKENWWSRGGGIDSTPIGDPCGPDSEVFYDYLPESKEPANPAHDDERFVEIGNSVFMEYRRLEDGSFEPLANKNVDFGGGLERLVAATIDSLDVFHTDLFWPVIEAIEELSGKKYESNEAPMRVIADHVKGATLLAAQGLTPSNKEQGYVMRRLLRRAMLKALNLGIEQEFLSVVVPKVARIYQGTELEVKNIESVVEVLTGEEKAFRATLNRGLRELEKLAQYKPQIEGKDIFKLQDTFGFPREIAAEEIAVRNYKLSDDWQKEFDEELAKQRERSQTAAKGSFKGGLEGDKEIHKKYHTATHLLGRALDLVLGVHAPQRGSHINDERLRLDVAYPEKITSEQLKQVEDMVNEQITKDLPVSFAEYDTDYALDELHATGEFREKYGDKVKVYIIGDEGSPFTVDVCGGPHVEHTGQLAEGGKKFRIIKEESSSAGVRRIKAILE